VAKTPQVRGSVTKLDDASWSNDDDVARDEVSQPLTQEKQSTNRGVSIAIVAFSSD